MRSLCQQSFKLVGGRWCRRYFVISFSLGDVSVSIYILFFVREILGILPFEIISIYLRKVFLNLKSSKGSFDHYFACVFVKKVKNIFGNALYTIYYPCAIT